jgi:hypothetical protein
MVGLKDKNTSWNHPMETRKHRETSTHSRRSELTLALSFGNDDAITKTK